MGLPDFFARHPVFTAEEAAAFLREGGSKNPLTRKSLIRHHESRGNIVRLRRGLYATVPPGGSPETTNPDPYLLAAKLAPDAVLAYHTALELYGKAYSVHSRYTFLTGTATRLFTRGGLTFQPVRFPKSLRAKNREMFAVKELDRSGLSVRVTSLERTLVDVLDRLDLVGGWEEAWRSLETVEFFDLDVVVRYTLYLGNATTTAKVGYFLDAHREPLMVEENVLKQLRDKRPKEPQYVMRDRSEPNRLLSDWNLMLPVEWVERAWETVR
jgi:predicted transcriptional regulator of viral defense system